MIILDIDQGTPEWHAARLGIPTSSNFGKILTSTGKKSTSAEGYMNEILAGWLAGKPVDLYENQSMKDGKEREAEARLSYEIQTGNEVRQIGFAYLDERRTIGASPDGLVGSGGWYSEATRIIKEHLENEIKFDCKVSCPGESGGLEIKCPKASTLISYYDKGCPAKYYPQVQGQMWVCNLEWVDFYAYHPDLTPYLFRVERDDDYIKSLAEAVEKFNVKLEKRKKELEGWKV